LIVKKHLACVNYTQIRFWNKPVLSTKGSEVT